MHRFFHQGNWPGDLTGEMFDTLCRQLLYLEIIFSRAGHRIWWIFGRAKLMEYQDLGTAGVLMTNLDLFEGDGDILDE